MYFPLLDSKEEQFLAFVYQEFTLHSSVTLCGSVLGIVCVISIQSLQLLSSLLLILLTTQSKKCAYQGNYWEAEKHARKTLVLNLVAVIGTVIGLLALLIIVQIIFHFTVYSL